MKVVIPKVDLLSLIGKIQGIVPSKTTLPILANILLEARDEQLILSATDLTTSMCCFIGATVIEKGAVTLPARRFFQLIRELTSPQVKISSFSEEGVEITSGSSLFKINGMKSSEFPSFPSLPGNSQISLSSPLLKEMLTRSAFAAARDDTRPVFHGILLSITEKIAKCIATDGKRLAEISIETPLDPSLLGSYILPIKSVEEMIRMIDNENSQKVFLSFTHDKAFLENGNTTLITKLVSGQYPDVGRVIPKNISFSVRLHREELSSLLRQISLFTSESSGSVRFIFQEGQLELLATCRELGEGTVMMAANYQGPRWEIAFNPHLFLDILRHISEETITLSLTSPYDPGIIRDSSSALFVIMPMRLGEVAPTLSSEPAENTSAII